MIPFLTTNITNFGLIAVIVWQFIQQIRSNDSGLTSKMLKDYKERNTQLESILTVERKASEDFKDGMSKIVADLKVEIVRLQSSNSEKDQHNTTLKELLLDKNPEVVTVLKEIRDSNKLNNESIAKVLSYQTEILEEWRDRSTKIDEASKHHTGDPIRVPSV